VALKLKNYNYYDKEDLTKENLMANPEFLADAYDFLADRNNNTDLNSPSEVYDEFMEHMRYSSVNEITALRDLEYAQNANILEKDKFGRLIDVYDKMPGEEFSWKMMGDYAEGLVTAPSTYLGILTGGSGKAASVAGTQIARLSLRKILAEGFKGTTKEGLKALGKEGLKGAVKGAAVEGAIGFGQGTIEQATRDETEVEYKSQLNKEYGRGLTTGIGSAIAGGLLSFPAGILGARQASKASEQYNKFILNTVREANIANDLSKKTLKDAPKTIKKGGVGITEKEVREKLNALDPEKVAIGRKFLSEAVDDDDFVGALPRHVYENITAAAIRVGDKIKIKKGERITSALQKALAEDKSGILTEDIKRIIREHNINTELFSYIYKAEISEAGRKLGQAGFIARRLYRGGTREGREVNRLLDDLDELRESGLTPTSVEEANLIAIETSDANTFKDTLYNYLSGLDRVRLGFMTSQPATTARNNLNAGFRVGVDAMVRTMDNLSHNAVEGFTKGKSGDFRGIFDGTADITKYMFDPYEAKVIQQLYREQFPEEAAILFRDAADLDLKLGNNTALANIARKSNYLNTLSDNYWKRVVLSASLSRRIKDKYGQDISKVIEQGQFNKIDDEVFEEAAKDALEFTYQNTFKGQDFASKVTRGVINAQRNFPFLISAFLPFPRFIASQLKFLVEHAPVVSTLNSTRKLLLSNKNFGEVVREDLGKTATGWAMYTMAYQWRLKQGDTNYWYEIKDNQGNIIDGRPLYGPFSLFMLMADYHYRLQTGTTPKDARGMLRDALQATLGSTFRVGAGLSFIENVLEKGSLEGKTLTKVLEAGGDVLGTYLIPFSVAKDIYSQFDPESRLIPETRKGDEVHWFDYLYSRATKSMPDFPLSGYEDPLRDPFRTGDVRAINPLEKQLFGFSKREKKNVLQEEMGRVNLTPFEIYKRHPNRLIDRYTRRDLSDPTNKYNLSKALESVIQTEEYQALNMLERREELLTLARQLINRARENAKEIVKYEYQEGDIEINEVEKAMWDSTRQTLKDSVEEEFKKEYPGFDSFEEYAKLFPNEAYSWANDVAKKLRKGRLGVDFSD
tara:strand:- start:1867 stop:5118 length:3252 start_codon:yes stop_codon:yes gene_type:complete